MAEEKTTKTKKTEKVEKVEKAEKKAKSSVKTIAEWKNKSIKELKIEFQKLNLEVKTGKEQNTALIRKLRKHIARALTQTNSKAGEVKVA